MRIYESRKHILITGASDFPRFYVTDRPLEQDLDVVFAEDLFTGSNRTIGRLHCHACSKFTRHDVTVSLNTEVKEICSLACPASPILYKHDPTQIRSRRSISGR